MHIASWLPSRTGLALLAALLGLVPAGVASAQPSTTDPEVAECRTDLSSAQGLRTNLLRLLGDPADSRNVESRLIDDSFALNPYSHWTMRDTSVLERFANDFATSGETRGGYSHLVKFRDHRAIIAGKVRTILGDIGGDKRAAVIRVLQARRAIFRRVNDLLRICMERVRISTEVAARPRQSSDPASLNLVSNADGQITRSEAPRSMGGPPASQL